MAAEQFALALDAALAMLARRDKSEQAIRASLHRKGFEPESIDAVIDRLRARNLLNDLRLAQTRIQNRSMKGYGLDRIRHELEAMGVEDRSIEAASTSSSPDQSQLIEATLRDRIAKKPSISRGAAGRFLIARGFTEDLVESALDSAFGTSDSSSE